MRYAISGLALALALAVAEAGAATITVTRFDDPSVDGCGTNGCSLREGVAEAGALPGADTVSLPAGTYVLGGPFAADVTMIVSPDTSLVGAGSSSTVIRSEGVGSMFRVGYGAVTFARLAIKDGNADGGPYVSSFGGAIRGFQAQLTLDRVVLADNHASQGGALYLHESTLLIKRSTLAHNDSDFGAGAIQLLESPATIEGSTIQDNTGSGGGGILAQASPMLLRQGTMLIDNEAEYSGGAIAADDVLEIEDTCALTGNVARNGGAIAGLGAELVVRGIATAGGDGLVEVSGNRAEGLYAAGGAVSVSAGASLERLALVNNEATYNGGAIYATQTDLVVRDTRIAGNLAGTVGGGATLYQTTATFERVAFDGNVATDRAGALYTSGANKVLLRNVDIHGNTSTLDASIFNASLLSLRHVTIWNNLVGTQRDTVFQSTTGSTSYANSLMLGRCTGAAASFSPLGNNRRTAEFANACAGTSTSIATLSLSRGAFGGLFPISGTTASASPLVNGGATASCVATDIRNAVRVGVCDLGAFEYGATP